MGYMEKELKRDLFAIVFFIGIAFFLILPFLINHSTEPRYTGYAVNAEQDKDSGIFGKIVEFFVGFFGSEDIEAALPSPDENAYWEKTVAKPNDLVRLFVELEKYSENPVSFLVYEQDNNECGDNEDDLALVQPENGEIINIDVSNEYISLLLPFNNQEDYGENTNFAYDFSRFHNNGQIYGASYVPGKYNKGLRFDGVEDYVQVNHTDDLNPGGGDFSVEFWFKPFYGKSGEIIAKSSGVFEGWRIGVRWHSYQHHHYLSWARKNYVGSCIIAKPVTDEWNHVVMTFRKLDESISADSLYLNGEITCNTTGQGYNSDSEGELYLGYDIYNDKFTNMEMDNIIIYRRALSGEEIKENYNGKTIGLAVVSSWQTENQDESGCSPPEYYFISNVDSQEYTSNLLTVSGECTDNDDDGYYKNSPGCPGDDCDDNNPEINPGEKEKCDGLDNNCDGITDDENSEGCIFYHKDEDDDGYGVDDKKCLCFPATPYTSLNRLDCDDTRFLTNPGAIDYCGNRLDDDCDGEDLGCEIGGAVWNVSSVSFGEIAGLTVSADNTGKEIKFQVYEQDDNECGDNEDDPAFINPDNTITNIYPGYSEIIPGEDISMHLKLNEESETATDSSWYDNNGQIYGASYVPGKYNKGLRFDGVEDYVQVNHTDDLNPGGGDFSVEFWFKPFYGKSGEIIAKSSGVFEGWRIGVRWHSYQHHHYLSWARKNYVGSCIIAKPVTDEWNHVVMTFRKLDESISADSLYLNGEITCNTTGQGYNSDSEGELYLGYDIYNDKFTNMEMDNIIIYRRALSGEEILAHYNNNIIAAKTNWIAEFYDEDECNPNEYYFIASVPNEPGQQVKSDLLTVTDSGVPNQLLNLQPGWNLVSVYLDLADKNVNDVFPDTLAVYEWDGSKYFVPSIIEPKKAYWVAVDSSQQYTLSGSIVGDNSVYLNQGWNLVGFTDNREIPANPEILAVYGWDGEKYVVPSQIEKGKGYWIASSSSIEI